MRSNPLPTACLAVLLAGTACVPRAAAAPGGSHSYREVRLSPDGGAVAAIERDDEDGTTALVLTDVAGGTRRAIGTGCGTDPACLVSAPVWRDGGRSLAFLVARPDGTGEIDTVPRAGGGIATLVRFDGPLGRLEAGPGGALAVLATAHAHKLVGATAAARPIEGAVGTDPDEQRIAVVRGGTLAFVSPPDTYVYEFAWLPDGRGFVGTAAKGDGDSNWWVARLVRFDLAGGPGVVLFRPGPHEQLADPVASPDGHAVGFIGGWMSDFGSTGGDAYTLPLEAGAAPVDVTPDPHETVTSLAWTGDGLQGAGIRGGGDDVVARLAPSKGALWSGAGTLSADGENVGLSCNATRCAAARQSFTEPPHLVVAERDPSGRIGPFRPIGPPVAEPSRPGLTVRSLTWQDDGQTVQGWLLVPDHGPARRALVVDVHGGPEAAAEPRYPAAGALPALLARGYDVLLPNYRGSFGQGEAFTQGSIHDVGGGDWRDVLSGVDAAERATPIDDKRLGIIGGSYGGYMAMQAVASTHRFAAAVAIAGVSDWLSIEGEAPEAGADATNFGASVYDDPAPYLKASPVMHIRGATTPSLVLVGDRDAECPMPQSQEFATALTALHVPVSFYVYRDEGHALSRPEDRQDETRRVIAWFSRYLGGDGPAPAPVP